MAEPEVVPPLPSGPAHWTAHWIAAPEAISGTNLMFLARRAFELPAVPGQAVLYITADTRYQLFVNGTFVARGPARSAAHHQSYDGHEVGRLLRPGRNTVAVRVHHAGIAPAYHEPPRPGLLVQLELRHDGDTRIIATDSRWRVLRDPSWDSASPRINRWHDASVDLVDLRKRLPNWIAPEFDDSAWPVAGSYLPGRLQTPSGSIPLAGTHWWPAAQADQAPRAVTPPWVALVPRDLPPLVETKVQAHRLLLAGVRADPASARSASVTVGHGFSDLPLLKLPTIDEERSDRSGLGNFDAYVNGSRPLEMSAAGDGMSRYLVFDLGEVHNAHPFLDLEGPEGAIVDVLCTPYLLQRTFDPTILYSFAADRIVLSGRREQWEAYFFKPARYLAVVVRRAAGPVRLHSAGVVRIAYPWARRGRFETPANPWLERFWQAGARTIEAVTTDAYTCDYRERRQYTQTSYYAAQGNYAAFGDTFLQRRYLGQNAEEQLPNGVLSAHAPMDDGRFMPFLDAQFFWVMAWRDYLLYSGDAATTRRLIPAAQRVMLWLAERVGRDGLMTDPPLPYWIDHSNLDRRGAHFVVNALYALTLDHFAEGLKWLGEPAGAGPSRRAAAALREALRTRFWIPDRGLFTDALVEGRPSSRFTEHANAIAVAAHIATPEQTRAILPRVRQPDPALVPATSLFVYWTVQALCQSGRVDDALSMLETRFAHQLQGGNPTLWEEWDLDMTYRRGRPEKTTRADSQAECGIFPMALVRWVAGIEAVAPGLREVRLQRTACSLQRIRAVLPSPLGDLHVAWAAAGQGGELTIVVPPGMVTKLDLESLGVPARRTLALDGLAVTVSVPVDRWYAIPAGEHRLTFRDR